MSSNPSYALPVSGKWLIYAPLAQVTAFVNGDAHVALIPGEDEPAVAPLADALRSSPSSEPRPKSGDFDPSYLALITTRGCNIACSYCDFGGPAAPMIHMDPEVAKRAISWMGRHLASRGREEFFLHLFGGEPMSSGNLIDTIIEHTRETAADYGLRPYVDISTNGVVSASRAKWMGEAFDSVVLSHDGPPEFQDRNRAGKSGAPTFEAVDRTAKILSEADVELCLRVCITADSVGSMSEILRWMVERYRPAIVNFEPLTENGLTAAGPLRAADPIEYARNWIEAYLLSRDLGVRLVYSATEPLVPRVTSCPVGSDALMVTPDGTVNGCYMQPADWLKHGMDMRLGSLDRDGVNVGREAVERLRELVMDKPRCRDCFCKWTCAGGCHITNTYNGCEERYVDFCVQTRIITACQLLLDLGEEKAVRDLLANDRALNSLAHFPSDYLFPTESLMPPAPPMGSETLVPTHG